MFLFYICRNPTKKFTGHYELKINLILPVKMFFRITNGN